MPGTPRSWDWLFAAARGFWDPETRGWIEDAREYRVMSMDLEEDDRERALGIAEACIGEAARRILTVTGLPRSLEEPIIGILQDEVAQTYRLLAVGTRQYEARRDLRVILGFERSPGQPGWKRHPDDLAMEVIEEFGWDAFWTRPLRERMSILTEGGYPASRARDPEADDPSQAYRRHEKRLRDLRGRLSERRARAAEGPSA